MFFSNNTSSDVRVVLVWSMYCTGRGNDSSFGMYNLTLGSTRWRKMNSFLIVQKSLLAFLSSWLSLLEVVLEKAIHLVCLEKISYFSPCSGRSRVKVDVLRRCSLKKKKIDCSICDCEYRVAGSSWAPEISTLLFFPAFEASRFHFPKHCGIKMERIEIRVKNNRFRSPFEQMPSGVKVITKTACSCTLHTDAYDQLDEKSFISSNHRCFQAFSQHGAIHKEAFRHGAHGDPRLRRQEERDHAGLATIDNEAVGGEQWSWDFISCRSKTQRKNTSLTRHLTFSTKTNSTQRQITRGKTLRFCDTDP